jgi:hypothetical protein
MAESVRVAGRFGWRGWRESSMTLDKIEKARRRRHGVAVKQGIKSSKQHSKTIKMATLSLRKTTKSAIVKRLFSPRVAFKKTQ